MYKLKKAGNIIFWVITPFLFVIAFITAYSIFNNSFPIRIYSVLSGSMEPALRTGSLIVVNAIDKYNIGDIVTYKVDKARFSNNMKIDTVTHRIIDVKEDGGNILFTTKGDANMAADKELVPSKTIMGKVRYEIPFMGYIITFSRNPLGFFILMAIPVIMICWEEADKIVSELAKRRKKQKLKASVNFSVT